jgi:hypothetical protein
MNLFLDFARSYFVNIFSEIQLFLLSHLLFSIILVYF